MSPTTVTDASNYENTTTSRLEWWFVVDPSSRRLQDLGVADWPHDKFWVPKSRRDGNADFAKSRTPKPVAEFQDAWDELNRKLALGDGGVVRTTTNCYHRVVVA